MTTDPTTPRSTRLKGMRRGRSPGFVASPRPESLERRSLPAVYLPAPADYSGTGQADLGVLRYNDNYQSVPDAQATFLLQPSPGASALQSVGYGLGLSGVDVPTPADFDGTGKADPAVYGFLDNTYYGQNYGNQTGYPGPYPFPNGAGRFAYIPSSGKYPTGTTNTVNGTFTAFPSKVVIVNLGGPGDLPAVGDYDGDHKADFAVYEPSKAQFLVYPSSTFNIDNDPTKTTGGLVVLPLGQAGDLPAPADYQGLGRTNFAVYEPNYGRFLVLPDGGGPTITVKLGGPGDVPVSADFDGAGRAEFAVYNQTLAQFTYLPAAGGPARTISVGSPGDLPAAGKYDGGTRTEFATFSSTTAVYHIETPGALAVVDRAMPDPNAIPVPRLDNFGVAEFNADIALVNQAKPDVLFLGDSITQRFTTVGASVWSTRLAQFNAFDFGSVGDTTQNLLWRIENGALATQPKVVVLTIGTNDVFTYVRSSTEIADSIQTIISEIHAKSPNSSILLNDTFPIPPEVPGDPFANKLRYAYAYSTLSGLDNIYLPAMAPLFSARTATGYLHGDYSLNLTTQLNTNPIDPTDLIGNQSLFIDSLHPNVEGYQVWADNLATPIRLMLDRPVVPSDFNGDGKTDIAVYGPSVRGFAAQLSGSNTNIFMPYGISGAGQSLIATGDYDGDGKADFAVYGPSVGGFAIHTSSTNSDIFIPFGIKGAGQSLPAPGDYDGDGKTDLAVYEPSLGGFEIHNSMANTDSFIRFGLPGAGQSIPVPGDYDGDGKTDLAVYMPSLGAFAYRPSSGGPDVIVRLGIAGAGQSIPAPGDYDGDGKTDLAVYEPTQGAFVYRPSTGGPDVTFHYGISGVGQSIPTPGNYDGDGKTDFAVYGPSVRGFAIHQSGSNTDLFIPYGISGAGQSLPTTSFDASISNNLGQPSPTGQEVVSTSAPTGKAKVNAGRAVPSGPSASSLNWASIPTLIG